MYEYEYELHNFHELPEIHELHEIHDELYVLRHVRCCVATIIWSPNRLVFLSEWQHMIVKLNFPPAAFGISKGQLQLQFSVRIAALRIVHCIGRRPSIAPANRIAGNCIASIAAANGIAAGERPVQVHHLAKNHCSALDRRRTLFNVDWSNSSSDSDRTCLKQKVEESSLFD